MMNRKGQLGKAVTMVPVMISVFLVMALFVLISFGIAKVKGPSDMTSQIAISFSDNNLLLESVRADGEENGEGKLFVDYIFLAEKGNDKNALIDLEKRTYDILSNYPVGTCLIIHWDKYIESTRRFGPSIYKYSAKNDAPQPSTGGCEQVPLNDKIKVFSCAQADSHIQRYESLRLSRNNKFEFTDSNGKKVNLEIKSYIGECLK